MNIDLFLNVFNNKVLAIFIFEKVNQIHKHFLKQTNIYKWESLLLSPEVMACYNYLDMMKEFFNSFNVEIALYGGHGKDSGQEKTKKTYTKHYKKRTLKNSILSNNLEMVKYFAEELSKKDSIVFTMGNKDILYFAVKYNRVNIVKYLVEECKSFNLDYCKALVASSYSNNIDLVKYIEVLVPKEISWLEVWDVYGCKRLYLTAFDTAARAGNLDMIKWLEENRINDRNSSNIYQSAIKGGQIEILDYIKNNSREYDFFPDYGVELAAENNHFEVVKWIEANKSPLIYANFNTKIMDYAINFGNLDMVKWLHENRTEGCTTDAMDRAALNDDIPMLKWLHENRTEGFTTNAINSSARLGLYEIVKWLHYNRTEGCTRHAMDWAAMISLDVVKFLHENRTEGCSTAAIDFAFYNSRYDIVKWLYANRTEGGSGKYDNMLDDLGLSKYKKNTTNNK